VFVGSTKFGIRIHILWHFFLGCNVFFHVPPDQTLIYRDAIPQISLRSPVPILRLYMGKSREWAFGEKQKFHMGSNVTKLRLAEEAFTVGFKKTCYSMDLLGLF